MSDKINPNSGDKIKISFDNFEGTLVYSKKEKRHRLTLANSAGYSAKVEGVACKILHGPKQESIGFFKRTASSIYDYIFCKEIEGTIATVNGPKHLRILVNKSSFEKRRKSCIETSQKIISLDLFKKSKTELSVLTWTDADEIAEIRSRTNDLKSSEGYSIDSMTSSATKITGLFGKKALFREGTVVMNDQKTALGKGGQNEIYQSSLYSPLEASQNTPKEEEESPQVLRKPIRKQEGKPRLQPSSEETKDLSNIYKQLREVNGLAVPSIIQYKTRSGKDKTVEVVKYYNQGSLDTVKKTKSIKMTVQQKKSVIKQVLTQVAQVHAKGLVHWDIKPGNILIDKKEDSTEVTAALADFDLCKNLNGKKKEKESTHPYGTALFASPENLSKDPSYSSADAYSNIHLRGRVDKLPVTPASDAWALGLTFYQLLFDQLPPSWNRENLENDAETELLEQFAERAGRDSKYANWHSKTTGNLGDKLRQTDDLNTKQDLQLKLITLGLLNPDPEKRFSAEKALKEFLEWKL